MSDQTETPKVNHLICYLTVLRAILCIHDLQSFNFYVMAQICGYSQVAWGVNDEIMVKGPTANSSLRGSRLPMCIQCMPTQEEPLRQEPLLGLWRAWPGWHLWIARRPVRSQSTVAIGSGVYTYTLR